MCSNPQTTTNRSAVPLFFYQFPNQHLLALAIPVCLLVNRMITLRIIIGYAHLIQLILHSVRRPAVYRWQTL